LKEVVKIDEVARTDEVILNTINYCLKNEVTKINTLLIFISFELGVTSDDLDSFQTFLEKFSHNGIKIGICVTRSEDKDDDWQQDIITQLKNHKFFSEVLERDNVKVLFTGCVDTIKNNTMSNIDDAKDLYTRVYFLREKIIQYIFGAEDQVMLIDLPIATKIKDEIVDLFEQQNEILDYLDNVTDFGLGTAQLKIQEWADNLKKIAEKPALLKEGDLQNRFFAMRERMMKIYHAIEDETTKAKFKGNLIIEAK
jgi:hypothetical protein